jgi:hypothetical protein
MPVGNAGHNKALAIFKNFQIGRGAGSCLVSLKISDTFQRLVRRFLSATSVPLPWFFRTVFSAGFSKSFADCKSPAKPSGRTTLCAAQARPAPCSGIKK